MEAMAERDDGALLGVDLVPRRSKFVNQHHPLPDFDDITEVESEIDAETDSRSVGKEEGEEDERIDEHVSNGSPFGGTGSHQGSETPNGLSTMEHQLLSGFLPGQKSSVQILHVASVEISENDITHLFSTATSEASSEEHLNGYTNGTMNIAETTILEEPIPELDDVEKVINCQESYDLFCPNCNSCITKRVILRRRKRKIQEISSAEDDRDIIIPEHVQNPSLPLPETLEAPIEETKQGAFECLSCFSIFIPIGRGFKLLFGGRESKETTPDAQQGPQLTTSTDAPGDILEDAHANTSVGVDIGQEQITVINQPDPFPEPTAEPTLLPSDEIQESMPVHDLMDLPVEQKLPLRLDTDVGDKLPVEYNNIPPETQVEEEQVQVVIHNNQTPALPSTSHPQQEVNGDQVVVLVKKDPDHTEVTMTFTSHTSPESEPLLPAANITEAAPTAVPVSATAGGDGPSDIDVIKSIVYGGLLESIASLSVVTAAAGADAKTLNIVALAAANMFGGLFILAHNLRVLKHENSNERYEEVLGRAGHFTFHAVVAVLSYIVFGLIPPLVYGFSFRESDNSNYKLIAVALASFVCIALLALGKAHTRTSDRDYIKTLTYYVSLWVMVCGVSYLAGELIHFVLEKLGLFDSTTSTSVGFIAPWVSYSVS